MISTYVALQKELQSLADCIKFKRNNTQEPLIWPDAFEDALIFSDIHSNFNQLVAGVAAGVSASTVTRWKIPVEGPQSTAMSTYIIKTNPYFSVINLPNCSYVSPRLGMDNANIRYVNLGVTALRSQEFDDCVNLSEVNIPSCKTIGYGVFWNNTNLQSINMPLCESIGYVAFYFCAKLSSLHLPNCKNIGSYAFQMCRNLNSITGLPSDTQMSKGVFSNCGFTKLDSNFGPTILPDDAFITNNKLTEIDLPEVTQIGTSAFMGCSRLTTAKFSKLTSIGSLAFDRCYALEEFSAPLATPSNSNTFNSCSALASMTVGYSQLSGYDFSLQDIIPGSLTYLSMPLLASFNDNTFFSGRMYAKLKQVYLGSVTTIPSTYTKQFMQYPQLEKVEMPLLTEVPTSTFASCQSLQYVSMPNVTKLNPSAFANCSNLTSITLGSSISYIGSYAFQNVPYDFKDLVSGALSLGAGAFWGTKTTKAILNPSISKLYTNIFSNCSLLSIVENTSHLSSIGGGDFFNTLLESIDLTNCKSIGNMAFTNCSRLSNIIFGGGSLLSIGSKAFSNCTNLSSFDFDKFSSVHIQAGAFINTRLPYLSNSTIDYIKYSGFMNNPVLSYVSLTGQTYAGVFVCETEAFKNCTNLTSVYIQYLSSIDTNLFSGCTKLEIVECQATSISSGAFYDMPFVFSLMTRSYAPYTDMFSSIGPMGEEMPYMGKYIYTTSAMYSQYLADSGWQEFIAKGGVIRSGYEG